VKLFWHDGLKEPPKIEGVPEGSLLGDIRRPRPVGAQGNRAAGSAQPVSASVMPTAIQGDVYDASQNYEMQENDGSVFLGDKGVITTGTYGGNTRLLPVEKMKDYHFPPELLTRSPGHYRDWIRACKGGDPACSNFNVSSPFVEWMLLGVIALRSEGKIEYDPAKMRITNNADANKYLRPIMRKGWTLA
jgi:hypothetical protein